MIRIPFSSENPLIRQIRKDKPVVKVLNKRDLADPEMTEIWLNHLEKEQGVKAIAITTESHAEVKKILDLCVKLAPNRTDVGKNIRTMIVGIPNVGKSTIINTLAGRVVAKTGNQPAVTRQQRINLQNGIVLSDTLAFCGRKSKTRILDSVLLQPAQLRIPRWNMTRLPFIPLSIWQKHILSA